MKHILNKLSNWLIKNAQQQEAQQVQELTEYEEPWHEEAVQEFGSEPISEEEYADQNFKEDISTFRNDILIENNFKTYVAKDKELGAGYYGRVYRGTYNGKPAAAKIITKEEGLREVKVWQKILNAADSLPPELKKHLPEIYLLKTDISEGQPYSLIVMEELRPLNRNLFEIINRFGEQNKASFNLLLKDTDYVYNLSKKIVKDILNSSLSQKMKNLTASEVFEIIFGALTFDSDSRAHNSYQLGRELKNKYQLDYDDQHQLSNIFFRATDFFVTPKAIPMSQRGLNNDDTWLRMPETKQYFEMLQELDKYGIEFDDQHAGNVMMGKDDNLKLIDVGAFDIGDDVVI